MVVVLMSYVKCERPSQTQMFDVAVEGTLNSNFHTWHSTACATENLCVECVRVQVKK